MARNNSFDARLTILERAAEARNHTGPLLTLPEGCATYLWMRDVAAIAAAEAEGKRVIMPGDDFHASLDTARTAGKSVVVCFDEPGPANPIPT